MAFVVTTASAPTSVERRAHTCGTRRRNRTCLASSSRVHRHGPRMQMNGSIDGDASGSNGTASNEASTSYGAGAYDASASLAGDDDMLDAEVRDIAPSELKCELLAALASTNRGFASTPDSRAAVESLVQQLENAQPCDDAAERVAMFTGKWRLLYTNALDVLSLGLLAPFALVSEVYQNIYEPAGDSGREARRDFDVENVVELEPAIAPIGHKLFGRTMTRLVVKVSARKTTPKEIALTFESASLKQEKVLGLDVGSRLPALKAPLRSLVGNLETTYLDEDLRISRTVLPARGGQSLFVLFREL